MSFLKSKHELPSPKQTPQASLSELAVWLDFPPEQTPQSSKKASPEQFPLQSMINGSSQ